MTDRVGTIGAGVLFAVGGGLAVYAGWALVQADGVIGAARDSGQVTEGMEFDVASYYMSSSGLYGVCALMLAVLGWVVLRTRHLEPRNEPAPPPAPEAEADAHDDELDDLFPPERDATGDAGSPMQPEVPRKK